MTHWGWYWKIKKQYIAKKLCENLLSIDSFKIFKNNDGSFSIKGLDIKAKSNKLELSIVFGKRKDHLYKIKLDKLQRNFGGYIYFFKCPFCQKRMRILYLAENSIFLCRKCLNLSYQSQQLRPSQRYDYMSNKIKEKIKNKGGDIDLNKKPDYMPNNKYETLKNEYQIYKRKSYQALNYEIFLWYKEKTKNHIDDYSSEIE